MVMWDKIFINLAKAADIGVDIPGSGVDPNTWTWGRYIEAVYGFSVRLGEVLVTIMIIYAGYQYLTSQGDTSKLNQAKDVMIGSIIGFVFLLLIGVILDYIGAPGLKK